MTTPQTPQIQQIEIAQIETGERMRPVSEAGVESLMASIGELGVMKDPVQLRRKGRGDKARLILMAGGHRLEAAKRLGWQTIPALVWVDVTNDWAALMEIDDNLSGSDLSTLELAVFMARRKEVYERMYPQTKHGGDRKSEAYRNQNDTMSLWSGDASDTMSFASSVAEKRDMSKRSVERLVAAGQHLSSRDARELSQAKTRPSLKDLLDLAKVEEEHIRVDVIDRLKHGTSKSVAAALRDFKSSDEGSSGPVNLTDQAFRKLFETWKRTPKPAQRMFVKECFDDLYPMLATINADGGET
ncbi:MAG: ParB N-terminal domain-containing protein [Pseudopelagicola sp.]|nr:ParB N-terminal domain-containing protein [Pseudopelagicola sp.]